MQRLSWILCIVVLFASCRSTKTVVGETDVSAIATSKLVKEYYENTPTFNTLAAKLRIKYKDRKNSQSVTVSLRMEKDKTIWMSASILGISLAKALVTPDRVSYYEKINGTFFDGDFSLLSTYFGVDMDFEQLQRLLLGETVYDLRDGNYILAQVDNLYQVTPKRQSDILNLFFFIEPTNFHLKKQQVSQPKDSLFLNVDYLAYQNIAGMNFPQNLFIEVNDNEELTTIEIDFRTIDVNSSIRFPFKIPNGYKEIEF